MQTEARSATARRVVAVVAGAVLVASVVADLGWAAGPAHAVRCAWGAREGWVVEHGESQTLAELREVVGEQTTCVPIDVTYVNFDLEAEGNLAYQRLAPRGWYGRDDAIHVYVEGDASQATDPCRPAGPTAAVPAGCAGGAEPAER